MPIMLLLLLIVTVAQVRSYSREVAPTFFLQGWTLVHHLMRFLQRMPYLNNDALGKENLSQPNVLPFGCGLFTGLSFISPFDFLPMAIIKRIL